MKKLQSKSSSNSSTYVAQKHIATSESHGDSEIHSTFLNTQDYIRVARPTTTETSSVVYLHVLDVTTWIIWSSITTGDAPATSNVKHRL